MTPERQRIKIAELCGTKPCRMCGRHHMHFPEFFDHQCQALPDYLNDLNAMHEAEKILGIHKNGSDSKKEVLKYCMWLGTIVDEGWKGHATAAQRAEAFLRTMGAWEE